MSGKPKKKSTVPEVDVIEEETVQTEEAVDDLIEETEPAETKSEGSSAPRRGAAEPKKKKSKGGFKLSSIDPIILASFTVFMVSCLIVTGVTVYGIVAGDSSEKLAQYGDGVKVDYVGSYFCYYDEAGASIFDTSIESIGEDSNYAKSYEYSDGEFKPLAFKAGIGKVESGNYLLKDFRDAVIGHRPGDVIKIKIENGYGTLTEDLDKFTVPQANFTIQKTVDNLSVSDYKALFNTSTAPSTGTMTTVKSPYGFDANVYHKSDDTIMVEYVATDGETYEIEEGVSVRVNTYGTTTINFDYMIDAFTMNEKMIRLLVDGSPVYVIWSDDSNMTYKTAKERVGIDLYFVITFVEYTTINF